MKGMGLCLTAGIFLMQCLFVAAPALSSDQGEKGAGFQNQKQSSQPRQHEGQTVEKGAGGLLESKPPFAERPYIRFSDLLDKPVRNTIQQPLGFCIDVVAQPDGRLEYLIVSSGSLFDIGEKIFPVPWKGLHMYLTGAHDIVLEVTKWTLYNGPSFGPGPWPDLLSKDWENKVHSYYGVTSEPQQKGKKKGD